jgi:hypothetical protein
LSAQPEAVVPVILTDVSIFIDQGMLWHIVGEGVSALITLLFFHVLPDHRIPIYSLIWYGSASLGSLKLRADSTIPPLYGTLA